MAREVAHEKQLEWMAGFVYGYLARVHDFEVDLENCAWLVGIAKRSFDTADAFEREALAEIQKLVDGG